MGMQTDVGPGRSPEPSRTNILSSVWAMKEGGATDLEVTVSLEKGQDARTIEIDGLDIVDRLKITHLVGGKLDLTNDEALEALNVDPRIKCVEPTTQQSAGPVF